RGARHEGAPADGAAAALPPDPRRDSDREQLDDHLSGPDRHPAAAARRHEAGNRKRGDVRLDELDYALPPELIAQEPAPERTAARLLVVGRQPEALAHETVAALPRLLRAGDLLVLNDARVVPA